MAKILGLSAKETREFMDDAQVAQGIIPQDILSDDEALKLMPAFFRTLRNEKSTKDEINKLIKLIKIYKKTKMDYADFRARFIDYKFIKEQADIFRKKYWGGAIPVYLQNCRKFGYDQ